MATHTTFAIGAYIVQVHQGAPDCNCDYDLGLYHPKWESALVFGAAFEAAQQSMLAYVRRLLSTCQDDPAAAYRAARYLGWQPLNEVVPCGGQSSPK